MATDELAPQIAAFREKVIAEWAGRDTSAAWSKYSQAMHLQLGPVTAALVETAAPTPGMTVLDLASGVGEPALSIAEAVAPDGTVTATDLSPSMLEALAALAKSQGKENIRTLPVDAHQLPFPDESFDLVTSRFGVMFFVEILDALAEVRRVLRPGGQAAFAVWGPASPGTFFGSCAMPYMKRLERRPDPDAPGPLRFAEPGKLAGLMRTAGFSNVVESPQMLPGQWPGTPHELMASMLEIATPFRVMVETLSADDRASAEAEILANLTPVYDGETTTTQSGIIIVSGWK